LWQNAPKKEKSSMAAPITLIAILLFGTNQLAKNVKNAAV